jgi:hypothetical protein
VESSSKVRGAPASWSLGRRGALERHRCSPEPRIRSHSTTGARGGSEALIGPSGRRSLGLWGNSDGGDRQGLGERREELVRAGAQGPARPAAGGGSSQRPGLARDLGGGY